MSTESTHDQAVRTRQAPRTGPAGRIVRLLFAAALGWVVYNLWDARTFIFAGTNPLHDPGLWIMTALVVYGLYELANLRGTGARTLTVLAALIVASAVAALVWRGTPWTGPLTWLVWGFAIAGSAFVTLVLLTAVVVGTPGCEIGVVRELARRWRGETDEERPMFCVAGLSALDAWSAASGGIVPGSQAYAGARHAESD